MELKAKLDGKHWILSWGKCGREEWFATKDFVADLPGRRYDAYMKVWIVRDNPDMRAALAAHGFQGDGLEVIIKDETPVEVYKPWKDVEIETGLFPDLRPYQIDYLRFMEYNNLRGGCGDEMGTGKTVQACSLLKYHPELRPAVICATSSTKIQWRREVRKWVGANSRVYILQGRTPQKLTDQQGIYIINWDILSDWLPSLTSLEPKALIGDEIQYIGGATSQRSKAFRTLAHLPTTTCLAPMSGTPVETSVEQYWPVLDALSPGLFPNRDKFLKRYFPYQMVRGQLERKAKRQEELHELTKHLWIRRLKSEVLPDLPEKTYCPVEMECSPTSSYDDALQKVLQLQGLSFEQLQDKLQSLSLSAFDVKRQAVFDWISDFLRQTDRKLTIFAWHHVVLDALAQALGQVAVRVDGRVTGAARDKALMEFQRDPKKRVFLGNITSAGIGLDGLQHVCSDAAYVEFSWSPARMSQSEDRFHRIGQKNPTNIFYLVAPGTIDEVFFQCLSQRRGDLSRVIDGTRSGGEDLKAVLNLLRRKA